MALFDKQIKKYVEENFSEKEKALAETERSVGMIWSSNIETIIKYV